MRVWVLAALFLSAFPVNMPGQGSVLLVGGGSEDYADWSDQPYRWLVQHALNRRILILHYAAGSAWLEGYFRSLGADSAFSLVVPSTASANDSAVYHTVVGCDGLFLRGGDQWQYVNKWRGTLLQQAIRDVLRSGGVVGGTSAGAMVLSQAVFDAQVSSVDPRTALRCPMEAGITITRNFLGLLPGTIVDTHFFERGRLGRLPAMMAFDRSQIEGELIGLGVDYNTALAVESGGVGQVMGAGTVTVLRSTSSTRMILQAGNPLSITGLRMDQLTSGFTFNLATGEIAAPPSAVAFLPKSLSASSNLVILDGSSSSTDWFRTNGSLRKLQSFLAGPNDTVGVFSSPSNSIVATNVLSTLASWGVTTAPLWIDAARANSDALAASVRSCRAFIFVANSVDSLGKLLSTETVAGQAFRMQEGSGTPAAFLADDVLLAGDTAVTNLYRSIYGAYYGYLTLTAGLGVLHGVQAVPRLYEQADYTDNRISGLEWSLGKSASPLGLLIDNGTFVVVSNGSMTVEGATPVMVLDARTAASTDFPTWIDPGKAYPRQNAAFIGATLHVLRPGDTLDYCAGSVTSVSAYSREAGPASVSLRNYPNPFNPSTTVEFDVQNRGRIALRVYDLVGRMVATLADAEFEPGRHAVRWNASAFSSGLYVCRMEGRGGTPLAHRMILLK